MSNVKPVVCQTDLATIVPLSASDCDMWLVIVNSKSDINPDRDHAYADKNGIIYIYNGQELVAINDWDNVKIPWGNLKGNITNQLDLKEWIDKCVQTISVNGTNIAKDNNKNVAIDIPITTIKLDGATVSPTNHVVDLQLSGTYAKKSEIPTKVSQLNNDAGYIKTEDLEQRIPIRKIQKNGESILPSDGTVNITLDEYALSEDVTKEIAAAISGIKQFEAKVVDKLPTTGENGILYLVANSSSTASAYDEYLWVGTKYELLGPKVISLDGYVQESQITDITTAEIDAMFGA